MSQASNDICYIPAGFSNWSLMLLVLPVQVAEGLNDTAENLLAAIACDEPEVSPSTLYATAAVLEGAPFINGSPQNTFVPGLIELAVQHNVLIGGDDFKSGQVRANNMWMHKGGADGGFLQCLRIGGPENLSWLLKAHLGGQCTHDYDLSRQHYVFHTTGPYVVLLPYMLPPAMLVCLQTKMKSVLVDFLVGAGLKPTSIVSYNHLGNNDGMNLSAPQTFRRYAVGCEPASAENC